VIVFTNGVYDLLHSGHITLLKKCRERAGINGKVIVGLNTDESVKRLKGSSRPINSIADRISVLEAIKYVDKIYAFSEDTPLELIKRIRPDVIVKGGDYRAEDVVGAEIVGIDSVMIVPLVKNKSTTNIIQKLNEKT
jgi:D-beta-D-heptose 7-phosphate kinase/D-beta-D-heptose 1-phosphate adenosyltransferase